VLVFAGIGLSFWMPYCIDRLLSPRIPGFASTFVFPAAYVSVELIVTLTSPFSSWGSLAYTQFDSLPLVQLVSVTGTLGITFLVTWTAAVVHWARRRRFDWAAVRRGGAVWAAVMIALLLFGQARLALGQPQGQTVRIGTVAATAKDIDLIHAAEADPGVAADNYQAVLADYLARTRQLAKSGARIVIWDELAVRTSFEGEAGVVAEGRDLAREENIYLLMGLRVQEPSTSSAASQRPRKNEAILIAPSGDVVFEYLKSVATPGSSDVGGDGVVATAQTPLGLLAVAICYDMDNPGLIRQAGRAHVGLMLVPAWDHPSDQALHMHMAGVRAVENGFSLVRSTREGLSAAFDNQGRLLAPSGRTTADGTMLADVPIEFTWTLYSVIGDLLGWLCFAGLGALTVIGIRRRKQPAAS
jgi:apolipoprotein N-acyltransferase